LDAGLAKPKESELYVQPLKMPANVRAGQVISLVEIVGGLGSTIDASKLADEFGADLQTLLPILDTGEMLGLVRVERGEVSLTEFGLKFQKTTKQKIRLLKDQISKIEPFKTSLELASGRQDGATTADICKALGLKQITWHHSQELNDALVKGLLIHWAIYAGLLTYDGKRDRFQKA
jgi:hypothetical protein